MPPRTISSERRLPRQLRDTQQRQQQATSQIVITDPTSATGDPAHNHAIFVAGYLGIICGINAYGAASFRTGAWVQL
jgi:hypothetical protein